MACTVQASTAFVAAAGIEAGAHGDSIHMPALVMGHAPIDAQAFTFQLDRILRFAAAWAHTIKAALQVAVTDEETSAVSIAITGFTDEQVGADLQVLVRRVKVVRCSACRLARGWKELRPLAGNAVLRNLYCSLSLASREAAQATQAQPRNADRLQRHNRQVRRLCVERIVIL